MTCVIIIYTEGWQELADIVIPNATYYCNVHGYQLHTFKYLEPAKSDMGYDKIRKMLWKFNHGCDIVWSTDLDLLITSHREGIEQYLDDTHDVYFTKDYNGLNCGSFIVRNTEWSKEFLNKALSFQGKEGMHCEQNAFEQLLWDDRIKILPQQSINAYKYELYPEIPPQTEEQGQWVEGKSLCLHVPGTGLQQKIDIFKNTKITL